MRSVILAVVCLFVASPSIAQVQDLDTGDYASTLEKGAALSTPPGIYAAAARNAEDAFWISKGGSLVLPPATVRGWQLDPATAPRPYVVIDVRPATMFAAGHVPGAFSIPLDVLFRPESLALLPVDGETSIITVCATGHTASMALGALLALGYGSVYTIRGGTGGWVAAGLPVEQ